MTRFLSITCMKNEGSFLLEWLAYNRAIGFTDVLVYSNDCEDGTDRMLDRAQELGLLTHVRNDDIKARGPQWTALRQAQRHPLTKSADWIMFHDVDEFLNIHVGGRRLPDLLATMPEADAFALPWRMFGNGGIVAYRDRPIRETFVHSARPDLFWPWRARMIKTLFRRGPYKQLGVHRPKGDAPGAVWTDGSGRRLPDWFSRKGVLVNLDPDLGTVAQINHYALGSMEGYLVKCDRGRANRAAQPFDTSYWTDRNFSQIEDRSILALPVEPIRDPLLEEMHAEAVAWRKARIRTLLAEDEWRSLFGRLLMAPPSRHLSPAEVDLILRHLPTEPPPPRN
ncbi:glycosyltransferase family 2 protein [Falsirhodobacter algicola]|uniref:Glycosyltransferase family 92 protein n=1 Tax=Falsirhodobacter algicola TaxID=2692330 RepID=A0A8J8SM30_9RHOB|nr:glycosyltransferase family 2 protein [Falsirhodobacter algicola]QUS37092.1 glycosyltransferase family 92 protein [Falsirhodobacter algicola]